MDRIKLIEIKSFAHANHNMTTDGIRAAIEQQAESVVKAETRLAEERAVITGYQRALQRRMVVRK